MRRGRALIANYGDKCRKRFDEFVQMSCYQLGQFFYDIEREIGNRKKNIRHYDIQFSSICIPSKERKKQTLSAPFLLFSSTILEDRGSQGLQIFPL